MNAEELVIGACLLSEDGIRFAADTLQPEDFGHPSRAKIFHAIVLLKKAGEPVEPFSVWKRAEELGCVGISTPDLIGWMTETGSAASIDFYAKEVKEDSARRKLGHAANRLMLDAANETVPPARALTEAMGLLKEIRDGAAEGVLESKTLGEVLDVEENHDWLIENLLEKGDRMIITGYEGLGKSTWIRQMAITSAAGINPITFDPMEPLRVCVVDAENTESQWRNEVRGMAHTAGKYGKADPRNIRLACSGRLDITRDTHLGAVHRLVDEHRPDILFIGPIYKLVPNGIKSDDEAAPLIAALDSLRDRGLALIMEGHSPKANSNTGSRDLSPRGSAALMGWPEFGFGLAATEDGAGAEIVRWRGDRDRKRQWPSKLYRGGMFPWTAESVAPEVRRRMLGWGEAA